jgi:hypothetical protein
MKMTLKKRMKINRMSLNPITMQLPLALMGNEVCISNPVAIITAMQTSSRRAKISI